MRPFRERSRRLPPADLEDVRQHLQDLQRNGIISESRSPYASPIVVVRKKSGKVRHLLMNGLRYQFLEYEHSASQ
ncbi:hypothetical protein SKAU_G00061570 [Synaphobranchus kaupii]|uniref:Uncharacterized protein n=1 Tax=Synaphobranchus kaupii TaxID=118154 RepID=A0A9Q1G507_SYNKA|nr:hypothetical protein SKAU_G00061570 [Synaphobranchus kaupii]